MSARFKLSDNSSAASPERLENTSVALQRKSCTSSCRRKQCVSSTPLIKILLLCTVLIKAAVTSDCGGATVFLGQEDYDWVWSNFWSLSTSDLQLHRLGRR